MEAPLDLDRLTDEELIERARRSPAACADQCLNVLYGRYSSKLVSWCLRFCRTRDEAADLAQDVLLRVHSYLDSFRADGRFSTWLYTVTHRVALDKRRMGRRWIHGPLPDDGAEPTDPAPGVEEVLCRRATAARLKQAIRCNLSLLEASIFELHFVEDMTLADISDSLELENKSGAKAYIVSAKRKLRRRLTTGRWRDLAPATRRGCTA